MSVRILLVPSRSILNHLIKSRELWDEIKCDDTVLCKICNLDYNQDDIMFKEGSYQIINQIMTTCVNMANMDDTIRTSEFFKNIKGISLGDIVSSDPECDDTVISRYSVNRAVFFAGCGSVILDCLSMFDRHACVDAHKSRLNVKGDNHEC